MSLHCSAGKKCRTVKSDSRLKRAARFFETSPTINLHTTVLSELLSRQSGKGTRECSSGRFGSHFPERKRPRDRLRLWMCSARPRASDGWTRPSGKSRPNRDFRKESLPTHAIIEESCEKCRIC